MVQGVKDLTPSICQTKQEDIKSKCHQQLSFELSPLNLPTAETEKKINIDTSELQSLVCWGHQLSFAVTQYSKQFLPMAPVNDTVTPRTASALHAGAEAVIGVSA